VAAKPLCVDQLLLLEALADWVGKGPSEPLSEPCNLNDDACMRWRTLLAFSPRSRPSPGAWL